MITARPSTSSPRKITKTFDLSMDNTMGKIYQISTKIKSGPICRIQLYGIAITESSVSIDQSPLQPGTTILQIHPLHSSISRSQTCPSRRQSFVLITSFFFNSLYVSISIHPSNNHIFLYYMLTKQFCTHLTSR